VGDLLTHRLSACRALPRWQPARSRFRL